MTLRQRRGTSSPCSAGGGDNEAWGSPIVAQDDDEGFGGGFSSTGARWQLGFSRVVWLGVQKTRVGVLLNRRRRGVRDERDPEGVSDSEKRVCAGDDRDT